MNDLELLELAAKAAGMEWCHYYEDSQIAIVDHRPWNPLTDDGDALRLAVKLAIDVNQGGAVVVAERQSVFDTPEIGAAEQILTCPYAATRRAIVRAAAEIGWTMP